MPIPESFIAELTSRCDIESVVSSYVPLKRGGRTLKGLCPFHGEKTASFTVYPETASFYCFGCGAGGDVITFIKQIENLDYLDAVKFLADRAGMTVPESAHVNDAESKLRVRVLEANRAAARFFHEHLYSPAGAEALAYYHKRGYTDKTIRHFGLGYAPNDYFTLANELRRQGFREDELVAAFLCKRGQKGGVYDVFRNRAMVPIIDIRGNVIAFGGRVLDDSKPKYVNTSDTPAFKKSRHLFALNFAKATAAKELILCEGYMDVIAMHQAGFENAVAALGTSFTEEHANLLARYTENVTMIFDSDEAGKKATRRAIDILRPTGVGIRVVNIPDGKDPDEFIKKNGAERFRYLLQKSAGDVEYRLIEIASRHDLNTDIGKTEYLNEAARLLASLDDPIECDVYAGRLAREMDVQKSVMTERVKSIRAGKERYKRKVQTSQVLRDTAKVTGNVNPDARQYPRAAAAEETLIGLLLRHPDLLKEAQKTLLPETLATAFNRRLYKLLLERFEAGLLVELPFLSEYYSPEEMAYITKMQQNAAMQVGSKEELATLCKVLHEEERSRAVKNVEEASDEAIRDYIKGLKK